MSIRISLGSRRSRHRFEPLLGGLICASLSVLGFFIAFGAERIDGGVPFIPDAWNQGLGRVLFGAGAALTAAFAVLAFREFALWHRHSPPQAGPEPGTGTDRDIQAP